MAKLRQIKKQTNKLMQQTNKTDIKKNDQRYKIENNTVPKQSARQHNMEPNIISRISNLGAGLSDTDQARDRFCPSPVLL